MPLMNSYPPVEDLQALAMPEPTTPTTLTSSSSLERASKDPSKKKKNRKNQKNIKKTREIAVKSTGEATVAPTRSPTINEVHKQQKYSRVAPGKHKEKKGQKEKCKSTREENGKKRQGNGHKRHNESDHRHRHTNRQNRKSRTSGQKGADLEEAGPLSAVAQAQHSVESTHGTGYKVNFDGSISPKSSTGDVDEVVMATVPGAEMMGDALVSTTTKPVPEKSERWNDDDNGDGVKDLEKQGFGPDDIPSKGPYCTVQRVFFWAVAFLFVAAAALVPCYFFVWKQDEIDSEPSDDFTRVSQATPSTVISELPVDICNEWIPGSGKSLTCPIERTRERGLLCNLVAKSMLNITVRVDVALINAGSCLRDLQSPELTAGDILEAIVPDDIVVLEIAGVELQRILRQAITASFGLSGNPISYPYASGLRFVVEANLAPNERVGIIEVNPRLEGSWAALDSRKFYRVATTAFLSKGGFGYSAFRNVVDEWKRSFAFQTVDTFYNFAMNDKLWWQLNEDEYSTQTFLGENAEKSLAVVPSRICMAFIPGVPETSYCSNSDVANGSGVCNLVAWALYDQKVTEMDFVLLTAGVCKYDIPDGKFGESSVATALAGDHSLVVMEMPSVLVLATLEEAVYAAITIKPEAYPYAAGLRFSVNTRAPLGSRVSNVEIQKDGSWGAMDSESYKVLTLSDLARGRDAAFAAILNSDSSTIQDLDPGVSGMLISYAEDWKVLYAAPPDKASTQNYIG